jgi:hypothetical protein
MRCTDPTVASARIKFAGWQKMKMSYWNKAAEVSLTEAVLVKMGEDTGEARPA